ncbi:helix-turn-helix domain-containing protein [Hydrocarboniphaga sp.]|uniref:helix-turn-helix domain-containing protein n=1 Tax=Hydrocarboniphaga sp. TaxID=2033016 RepID=UPI003D13C348
MDIFPARHKLSHRNQPIFTLPRIARQTVPKYQLYGEHSTEVDDRYVHVESIRARSEPNSWHIRPHSHRDLHHLLLVLTGGGQMHAEDRLYDFAAPALIRVPACFVHGFRFATGTEGWIITSSNALLGRFQNDYPELEPVFSRAVVLPLLSPGPVQALFDRLVAEFQSPGPAHRAAMESSLVSLLVAVLRLSDDKTSSPPDRSADSPLVMRFLQLLDAGFRGTQSIADYVSMLHVSHERLRQACLRLTGVPPLEHLSCRRLLEAKRELLYTNMSIAQIAASCGLQDPAYFSRFFTKRCGVSPSVFRSTRRGMGNA